MFRFKRGNLGSDLTIGINLGSVLVPVLFEATVVCQDHLELNLLLLQARNL